MYRRWIHGLEERHHQRDNNRLVRSFAWGLDYLNLPEADGNPGRVLAGYAETAFRSSQDFYAVKAMPEFFAEGDLLTFASPIQNRHLENNTVYGRYFHRGGSRAAVVVLPHWNAQPDAYMALCRLLNRFGMTALRLSLPYHDRRRPPELERADYLVDSNIGRTLQANRQAVLETRVAVEWLSRQGFRQIGVLGTSIGACIGFLAFAHEPRLRAGVFNHASSYFADVVWNGMTTRHVRNGLDGCVTLEELRRYWSVISPLPFVSRMDGPGRRTMVVSARYDPTFLPHLTQDLFEAYRRHGIPLEKVLLPCGHYTLGMFPFSWIDGYVMARFLKRELDFSHDLQ